MDTTPAPRRPPSRRPRPDHGRRAASLPLVQAGRDLAAAVGELVRRAATHVDELSLDLARDAGQLARSSEALTGAARAGWDELRDRGVDAWSAAARFPQGAPRIGRVVGAGLGLLAQARWHRLRAAAATGQPVLTDDAHRALAARVRELCVELRGGVLKLGQIASCRPDLIGPVWAGELAALQDRVPPVDADAIVARVEAELGAPLAERFAEFEREPVAAASLAQVHRAVTLDGQVVAVKVQVPGIDRVIAADVAALRVLAGVVGEALPIDLATIADELDRALATELDYRAEADAARAHAADLAGTALTTPAVIAELSTERVLTTAFVDGTRLTDALDAAPPELRTRIVTALCDGLARSVFVTGRVHADPHPGNFLVGPAGELVVLDFGCMLVLDAGERRGYARLLAALAMGDRAGAAALLAELGFAGDHDALAELAAAVTDAMRPGVTADAVDWEAQGRALVMDLAGRARLAHVTIPPSFVLLGRVLGTMAGLVAVYRPPIQLHAIIAPYLAPHLAPAGSAGSAAARAAAPISP